MPRQKLFANCLFWLILGVVANGTSAKDAPLLGLTFGLVAYGPGLILTVTYLVLITCDKMQPKNSKL